MNTENIHSWTMEPIQAIDLQRRLRERLVFEDYTGEPELIAGVDVSFPSREIALAVVVIMEFRSLRVIEYYYSVEKINTPYIPGLLSFREGPTILKALSKSPEVDLIFFDGHGIAHPRGVGIASHIGLFVKKPTIGIAKSLLYGELKDCPEEKGEMSPILAPDGRLLGYAVRTRMGVKPIFVSPGNRITPESAVDLVLRTTGKYRIPEPTRQAHILTQELKGQLIL